LDLNTEDRPGTLTTSYLAVKEEDNK
jgi:hypothetical protein